MRGQWSEHEARGVLAQRIARATRFDTNHFDAAVGEKRAVADLTEKVTDQDAHIGIVVDDQNGFSVAPLRSLEPGSSGVSHVIGKAQANVDRGALAGLAVDAHRAAGLTRDAIDL